jgi:hypothetical protein
MSNHDNRSRTREKYLALAAAVAALGASLGVTLGVASAAPPMTTAEEDPIGTNPIPKGAFDSRQGKFQPGVQGGAAQGKFVSPGTAQQGKFASPGTAQQGKFRAADASADSRQGKLAPGTQQGKFWSPGAAQQGKLAPGTAQQEKFRADDAPAESRQGKF